MLGALGHFYFRTFVFTETKKKFCFVEKSVQRKGGKRYAVTPILLERLNNQENVRCSKYSVKTG